MAESHQHYQGESYSERNPVPTVKQFREIEAERERVSELNQSRIAQTEQEEDAPAPPAKDNNKSLPKEGEQPASSGGGAAEKERLKAAATPQDKPTKFEAKGERRVKDPVTGKDVIISDATSNAKIDPHRLDSRYEGGYATNIPGDSSNQSDLHPAPKPAEPTSILLQQFPPPVESGAFKRLQGSFRQLAIFLGAAMAVTWFFVAFGAGWLRFFFRTGVLTSVGVGGWTALNYAERKIERELEAIRHDMHKQRGEKHSPPVPESAEWLNAAIAIVWKQINPEMFVPMADQVEDIMQQSLPKFIDAVKISDIGHGSNPFRFIAFRGLADAMTDAKYPREEWITDGKPKPKPEPQLDESGKPLKVENDADGDGIDDDDESGDFLNYEVSFSYSAEPGQTDKSKNIHLLVEFFMGAYDLFRVPFPVWVSVMHISGTLRLRAQMVAAPPYIRNLTFTLMGVPKVEISVTPMMKSLGNVLDLPVISGFVQSSIAAAANEYVAPKSMTLNMAQMLAGDGIKKDTDAVGVLIVRIHHAIDLSAQDAGGKSDPYVVLAFAKFGRPLYSSRIIFEDLNPVWEETAFLLVNKDDIRGDESLSVQLWDSDKRTADDIVGRVTAPLSQLMETPNQLKERTDKLMGFEDADTMQGELVWSVGFFEKAKLNRDLMDKRKTEEKSEAEQASDRQGTAVDTKEEADALHTPPDPKWPSGILSLHVHFITGLENRKVEEGVMGKDREGTFGQDVDADEATGKQQPSSYCELLVNDDIVFRTRTKPYTSLPYFEAGTEVFVRDWQRAHARIVVRDARVREHDPIMGIVSVPLTDLFDQSSQVSRAFSLQDGVGYGRVQASFVFKSIKSELPRELLGWDTATVELLSNITLEATAPGWESKLDIKKITASTGDVTRKLRMDQEQPSAETDDGEIIPFARLPVYDRYSTNLIFTIGGGGGIGPIGGKPDAIAVLPLTDVLDDEVKDVELAILAGENLGTLGRNHISDVTARTHKYERVGTLRVKFRLDSGLDYDHEPLAKGQTDKHIYETWNRLEGMPKKAEQNAHANDDGVIDSKEQKEIDRAKTQALHARHRGVMGYSAARTGVWAKDGLKERLRKASMKLKGTQDRDQTVKSEA